MVFADFQINQSYWESFTITQADIEFLYAYLLDKEKPLPSNELADALIQERIRSEKEQLQKKQQENGEIYQPKEVYAVGDKVQFPAMDWINGTVTAVREGNNPEHLQMKVITVELSDGKTRQFAAGLENHILNTTTLFGDESESDHSTEIVDLYSDLVTQKLEHALLDSKDLIRIGAVWFAKSLLIEFNVGHLNLAEALLDMHNGGPLPVSTLLEQIDIETDDPQDLIKFSLNYALQEDPRFDEVGPTGEIQWFLNRLEPQPVREIPIELSFTPIEYDRSDLDDDMLRAEQQLDDELTDYQLEDKKKVTAKEVAVVLNYPHWRIGSIPLTPSTRSVFPTALETPRVKFKMIDTRGQEISAWVVRPFNYVYGLRDWYDEMDLMPGSIIKIKPGKEPGEVLIQPEKKRSNREWIRTLLIGTDGGVVFAMLKQTISADFNERMAIAVPSTDALDELWKKRVNNPRPLKNDILNVMRELAKLNPQGHVHSVELYAGVNCIRRCPPGLVFSILTSNPEFTAVGDLYYRLSEHS
jgi:plastocyanin